MSHFTAEEERILDTLAAEIRRQVDAGDERLDIERLTALAPWSRRQIERRFRDKYLTSPARYFRDCQWDCARRLLLEGTDVLTASVRAGFASPGRLHDAVVVRSGFTPGEIRRRGAGVHLNFGFFETPIGIVMLATLSLMGMENIHEMNALKTLLATLINGVAVVIFALNGAVYWPQGLLMVVGAIIGGYGGAYYARKLDPRVVRRFVIVVGFVMTAYFFFVRR